MSSQVCSAIWALCARDADGGAPSPVGLEAGALTADRAPDAEGGELLRPADAPRRIEVERAAVVEPVPYVAPSREVLRWVDDLADDDVRFNALRALRRLSRIGAAVAPELHRALLSTDWQKRQLAAQLLREHDRLPSDLLLEVTVEGLGRGGEFSLAEPGARFLNGHALRARTWLIRGLGSTDDQRRFLCAFLLAQSGSDAWIGRTAAILIEHLGDNRIQGDAVMSAHALYRLGRPALPFVRAAAVRADPQALSLLRLIELDIEHPPRTRQQLERRRQMHSVTRIYFDPVIQFDLYRSRVATW